MRALTHDEHLAQGDPFIDAKVRVHLIIEGALDNEMVGSHVNNMKWDTLDLSSAPHRLLTSDRPVTLQFFKEPKGGLSIPISPTKLFVAANDFAVIDRLRRAQPRDIVRGINQRTVMRARKFVWANDETSAAFIRKRMSKAIEPTPFFRSRMPGDR